MKMKTGKSKMAKADRGESSPTGLALNQIKKPQVYKILV